MKLYTVYFILKLIFMTSLTSAQNGIKSCKKMPSQKAANQVEIHCSCMEQFVELKEPLYKLTVNQTGCEKTALKLDWGTLQSFTKVQVIVFIQAYVAFDHNGLDIDGRSSIVEVVFDHSNFKDITDDAFRGLRLLETLRVLNSEIEVIRSNSLTGFHNLKTLEFAQTNIKKIEKNAFADLPQIEFLAFIKCDIGTIESDAVHILNQPKHLPNIECPPLPASSSAASTSRSRSLVTKLFSDVTGRSLQSLKNVSLPEYGGKLLFFASTIDKFESKSIHTKVFAYIILGGNTINVLKEGAFEAQLQNECDVSALLIIGNNFTDIESNPLRGVTGNEVKPSNTFIGVIDNVFHTVSPKGFSIDKMLGAFQIHGNKFACDCKAFPWILSNEDSEAQKKLEKNIVETSACDKGGSLTDFLKTCDELTASVTEKSFSEGAATKDPGSEGLPNHSGQARHMPLVSLLSLLLFI